MELVIRHLPMGDVDGLKYLVKGTFEALHEDRREITVADLMVPLAKEGLVALPKEESRGVH